MTVKRVLGKVYCKYLRHRTVHVAFGNILLHCWDSNLVPPQQQMFSIIWGVSILGASHIFRYWNLTQRWGHAKMYWYAVDAWNGCETCLGFSMQWWMASGFLWGGGCVYLFTCLFSNVINFIRQSIKVAIIILYIFPI